jgi:hypothetical protein
LLVALLAGAVSLLALAVLFRGRNGEEPAAAERQREILQKRLANGEVVPLIGEDGPPLYHQVRASQDVKAWKRWDSLFTVDTQTIALVELLPDPMRSHYRFSAEVRQNEGFDESEVGIYFGYSQWQTERGTQHYFLQLSFADLGELANGFLNPGAGPDAKQSQVGLFVRHYSEPASGKPEDHRAGTRVERFFTSPLPELGRVMPWRTLTVEVAPNRIVLLWEKERVELLRSRLAPSLRAFFSRHPAHTPPVGPRFDPRDGLGLYVRRGSASFRSVTITPLP